MERRPGTSSVARRGRAGGPLSMAARVGRGGTEGSFGVDFMGATAVVTTGAVTVLAGPGGGGGGRFPAVVGGSLKFFCLLSAAMRSASVVYWGSSASAMAGSQVGDNCLQNTDGEKRKRGVGRIKEGLNCRVRFPSLDRVPDMTQASSLLLIYDSRRQPAAAAAARHRSCCMGLVLRRLWWECLVSMTPSEW